jgi:hypothetical protein
LIKHFISNQFHLWHYAWSPLLRAQNVKDLPRTFNKRISFLKYSYYSFQSSVLILSSILFYNSDKHITVIYSHRCVFKTRIISEKIILFKLASSLHTRYFLDVNISAYLIRNIANIQLFFGVLFLDPITNWYVEDIRAVM